MTFNDIFKTNFLDSVVNFSVLDTVLAIVISLLLGTLIFFVYKKTYSGVLYSRNFNITLLAMTMITTMIIIGVTSNVVLSLGMVGALSIVRFRTAIKDPMDTFYIFWSIGIGILCGAGQFLLAIVGSVTVAVLLVLVVNRVTVDNPYLLVLTVAETFEAEPFTQLLTQQNIRYQLKTHVIQPGYQELTYELRLLKDSAGLLEQTQHLSGVESTTLLAYDGNFAA